MINTTNNNDIILNNFTTSVTFNYTKLPMITVYYNALDYQSTYSARLFYTLPTVQATRYVTLGSTMTEIQNKIPYNFYFTAPSPYDEKHIVGTYIG